MNFAARHWIQGALTSFAISFVSFSPVSGTPQAISLAPYANRNIQQSLFPTFPTGHVIPPKNSFGVPFNIPLDGPNFIVVESTGPLVIHVGAFGVKKVFTLMQAYGPVAGDKICSIEFNGSAGADQVFPMIVGVNVRDFFESNYCRTINNTSTQPAFECIGRGGAYTDDTKSGPRGFYNFDEQEFDLNSDFANQTLNSMTITLSGYGGRPMLLGVTADTYAAPAVPFYLSFRFWFIIITCLLILAVIGLILWIRRWLNAP